MARLEKEKIHLLLAEKGIALAKKEKKEKRCKPRRGRTGEGPRHKNERIISAVPRKRECANEGMGEKAGAVKKRGLPGTEKKNKQGEKCTKPHLANWNRRRQFHAAEENLHPGAGGPSRQRGNERPEKRCPRKPFNNRTISLRHMSASTT